MNRHDSKVLISGVVVFLLVAVTAVIFGSNAEESAEMAQDLFDDIFQGMTPISEEGSSSGELTQGGTETVTIVSEDRAIMNISAVLTWSDEPDQRRIRVYQNQPDTFSISITDPNGNVTDTGSASNSRGGEGRVELQVSMTQEEAASLVGTGNWTIDVTLDSVGDYEARLGVGLWPITPTDSGNDFSLTYEIEYYDLSEEE